MVVVDLPSVERKGKLILIKCYTVPNTQELSHFMSFLPKSTMQRMGGLPILETRELRDFPRLGGVARVHFQQFCRKHSSEPSGNFFWYL